jgi:UDPglucose 6-dehydrogenase
VDALVICTDWAEFRHPEYEQMKQKMKLPIIFDGRNLYRLQTMAEEGFVYWSVGRGLVK